MPRTSPPRLRLRGFSLRRRPATALVAGLLTLALAPTAAEAGVYRIDQCSTPLGEPAGVSSEIFRSLDLSVVNACGTRGQLEMRALDHAVGSPSGGNRFVGFEFRVPDSMPNTRMLSVAATISVAAKNGAPGQVGLYEPPNPVNSILIPAGAWGGFADQTYLGQLSQGRVAQYLLGCDGVCQFSLGPTIAMRRASIDLYEEQLPLVPVAAKTGLLDGTAQRGLRTLRVSTADADSGVRRVEARGPGGLLLATVTADCSWDRPIPCPQTRATDDLQLDTTKLPDGVQTVEVWVTDAAGNERHTVLPSIVIDNAARAAATPAPTPTPTVGQAPSPGQTPAPVISPGSQLAITFKPSANRFAAGRKITLSGALVPAPAAAQRVVIEAKKGKRWITAAIVRTRAAGRFSWSHHFRTRGSYTMRARVLTPADSALRGATSPARTFRVR